MQKAPPGWAVLVLLDAANHLKSAYGLNVTSSLPKLQSVLPVLIPLVATYVSHHPPPYGFLPVPDVNLCLQHELLRAVEVGDQKIQLPLVTLRRIRLSQPASGGWR